MQGKSCKANHAMQIMQDKSCKANHAGQLNHAEQIMTSKHAFEH